MTSSRLARTGSRVRQMTSPTGSDPRRHRARGGFTLLELLVVMLIVTILAGVAIPQFRRTFRNLQLQVFASDVATLLTYANRRAVARGEVLRVHFDVDRKSTRLNSSHGY